MKSTTDAARLVLVVIAIGALAVIIFLHRRAAKSLSIDSQLPDSETINTPPAELGLLKLSDETVRKELTDVIRSQLAAFRENDYSKAYTFAAVGIKKLVNLEDFEKMVKQGYPAIARHTSFEFGTIIDNMNEALAEVRLSSKGTTNRFQYLLRREGTEWKIDGVLELKSGHTQRNLNEV